MNKGVIWLIYGMVHIIVACFGIINQQFWLYVLSFTQNMFLSDAPVSYTHLDVYKRQG